VKGTDPRPRIVVDPGHGGWDSGALGLTGTREADIALGIARRLAKELEDRLDAEVFLTRQDDTFMELRDRAAMANALDADLFLSVHANAAPGPTAWGIETYYLSDASDSRAASLAARENATVGDPTLAESLLEDLALSGTHALSRALATGIQTTTVSQLREVYGTEQIRDLGVKTARFYVLVFTRMPAVLYEASFLTNDADEMRLRQPLFQQRTAEAIASAVEAHLEATR
jgi:N-acetylmuramoyl-L-alanine amidase